MNKIKKRLTNKELETLSKSVISYYFNNPNANSYDEIQSKFNIHKVAIRKILSEELDRRLQTSISRKFIKSII